MACHNFKRTDHQKMPPNKWTKTFPFTLFSIYALALLLPSLAEFSQAAAPWLLALHQNWFPRLTNPGIPAQKRAACTKFANSEIPARNFAKLPALKNYAYHNWGTAHWGRFESSRSWKIGLVIKIPSNVQRFPPINFFLIPSPAQFISIWGIIMWGWPAWPYHTIPYHTQSSFF